MQNYLFEKCKQRLREELEEFISEYQLNEEESWIKFLKNTKKDSAVDMKIVLDIMKRFHIRKEVKG